jgi:hypothetical protein
MIERWLRWLDRAGVLEAGQDEGPTAGASL